MVIGGDHQYKKRLDEAQDGLITLKWGQILNLFLAWHFPLMNSEWMQDDLQVQNSPQPDELTHCKPSTCNVFIYVCVSILCIYVITVNKHNNSICLIVQTNHIVTYPHQNFLPRPLHFLGGRRLETLADHHWARWSPSLPFRCPSARLDLAVIVGM